MVSATDWSKKWSHPMPTMLTNHEQVTHLMLCSTFLAANIVCHLCLFIVCFPWSLSCPQHNQLVFLGSFKFSGSEPYSVWSSGGCLQSDEGLQIGAATAQCWFSLLALCTMWPKNIRWFILIYVSLVLICLHYSDSKVGYIHFVVQYSLIFSLHSCHLLYFLNAAMIC